MVFICLHCRGLISEKIASTEHAGSMQAYLSLLSYRGLTSESGQNNCFLNVIIQSLWHLDCFRGALLAPARPQPRGPLADRRVMDALVNIFRAFAAVRSSYEGNNLYCNWYSTIFWTVA